MTELMACDWPGNVRQLANVIERAAILGESAYITGREVRLAFQKDLRPALAEDGENGDLPGAAAGGSGRTGGLCLKDTLREVERTLILGALDKAGGRQAEAARLLGVSPKNLWNKLQKHGIGTGS
jgi:two-component system response regulator AtoC